MSRLKEYSKITQLRWTLDIFNAIRSWEQILTEPRVKARTGISKISLPCSVNNKIYNWAYEPKPWPISSFLGEFQWWNLTIVIPVAFG